MHRLSAVQQMHICTFAKHEVERNCTAKRLTRTESTSLAMLHTNRHRKAHCTASAVSISGSHGVCVRVACLCGRSGIKPIYVHARTCSLFAYDVLLCTCACQTAIIPRRPLGRRSCITVGDIVMFLGLFFSQLLVPAGCLFGIVVFVVSCHTGDRVE